jgi:addiction module HigA family antidote
MSNMLPPIHPGEIIQEDFLGPLGMTVLDLSQALDLEAGRLNEVVCGRRAITADVALRLARHLGTSAEFWMRLQSDYELRVARQEMWQAIERAVQPRDVVAA